MIVSKNGGAEILGGQTINETMNGTKHNKKP
jgi:hypothetical protein